MKVETTTQHVSFPSPPEYVRLQFAATPLAYLIEEMPGDRQATLADAVIAEVGAALRPYVGGDGLVFPKERHTLSASAGGA